MIHPAPASAHPGVERAYAILAAGERLAPRRLAVAPAGYFPDLSEFNGAPDWDELERAYRAGQILAVAMRAGFGTVGVDRQFARNQAEARRRGIPVIYYWFTYAAYNTPTAEAAMFNATVGPLRPREAMCGDFEDDPAARPFPRGAAGLQWCEDFLGELQAPRNASWGYSYPFLISVVGLQPLFDAWPFWLADYSFTPDSAFDYPIARQFTDCGATPGVGGCCDQSRVLKAPLEQWLTSGTAPSLASGQTGGSTVLVPSQHPTKPGRFDYLRVKDGELGRAGSVDGGVGGAQNYAFTQGWVDYGHPDAGPLLPEIGVTWTGDDRQVVTGTTADGKGVSIVLNEDGTVSQGWTVIGDVDLPATGVEADDKHIADVALNAVSTATKIG